MTGDRQVISGRQMVALLVLMRLEVVAIFLPVVTAIEDARDAWPAALVATVATFPLGFLVAALAGRFPGLTLIEMSRRLLGRVGGALVGGGFVLFFFHLASSVARNVGEAYTAEAMTETPWLAFALAVLALAALGASCGVEVLGRAAEAVFILGIVLFALLLLLVSNTARAANLLPLLEGGFRPVLQGSLISFSLFGEVIVSWMLIPHLDRPERAGRYIAAFVGISGAVLVAAALTAVAVFGPTANSLLLPVYSLARIVRVVGFIERVEIIPLAIWTFAAWLKIGLFLWVGARGLGQLLGLRDHRPLVFPLAFLAAGVSHVLYEDIVELMRFFRWQSGPVYRCSVELAFIGILWAAALLRPGRRKRGGAQARVGQVAGGKGKDQHTLGGEAANA